MWKEAGFKDGVIREEDLKTKEAFFKHFAEHGVQFIRYPDSDRSAAREIVQYLLKSTEEISLSAAKERRESESKHKHSASRTGKVSQLLRLFGVGKRSR
jgi:hypothetical protein